MHNAFNGAKITQKTFAKNMEEKKLSSDFRGDITPLLPPKAKWNFDEAFVFFYSANLKGMGGRQLNANQELYTQDPKAQPHYSMSF